MRRSDAPTNGSPLPAGAAGRRARLGAVAGVLVTLLACTGLALRARAAEIPLYSQTVALDAAGRPVLVEGLGEHPVVTAAQVLPGTRVLADPQARPHADAEASWLAAGTTPIGDCGREPDVCAAAARDALLDLHVLLRAGGGVPVAGWSPQWRYVWPRDAAFAVAALDATGHRDDAAAVLDFLQANQHPDGTFEARYRPDGSGPPDARGVQLDGSAWALWALDRHVSAAESDAATLEPGAGEPDAARWDALHSRSLTAVRRALDTPDGLPRPGPDYWERREKHLTLGVAAPLLAGLQAAQRLQPHYPEGPSAADLDTAATALERAVLDRWRPHGFTRDAGRAGLDAAVTFLLPPFVTLHDEAAAAAVRAAWVRAVQELARDGGGLAPGQSWPHDGVSWTPETGLFALTAAAAGQPAEGTRLLGWLVDHRTAAGSYPEKVLDDGRPAAVAPLAWTASLVLLCLQG